MASTSAFQAEHAGSIPATRSTRLRLRATPRFRYASLSFSGCLGVAFSLLEKSRIKHDCILTTGEAGLSLSAMHFVYVLESADSYHWYFGVTNDVKRRLAEHNGGKSIHTNKFKPWSLRLCVTFKDRNRAEEFEIYLKSHAGRAFMKKHFQQ